MDRKSHWSRAQAKIVVIFLVLLLFVGILMIITPSSKVVFAQQPTGSVPTVTGTRAGPIVTVYTNEDIIGVFAGPSTSLYPRIGILLAGETAPALGYSVDREWIKIVYMGVVSGNGWIYAPFVSVEDGLLLPILPNPPTATPRTTPTIDPTQAALYGLQLTQERLPTFTSPAPIELPDIGTTEETRQSLPMGLLILVVALIGILGAVISFTRGR